MDTCCIQTPLYRKDKKKCFLRVLHINQNKKSQQSYFVFTDEFFDYIFRHAFIDTPIDVECWYKNERLTGLRLLPTFLGPQGVLSAAITP